MKAFEFPLERVMRWRNAQLGSEEAKLRRLVEEQVRIQQRMHHLRDDKLKIEASAAGLGSLHGHDLAFLAGYRQHAASEEKRLLEALRQKDREIAEQQLIYREAKRRCRLLEELRGRKLTAWRREWNKEMEEIAAESFAAVRFRAQSGEEG